MSDLATEGAMWFIEIEDVVQAKSRFLMWKKRECHLHSSSTDKVLLSLGMLQRDSLLLLRSHLLLHWSHFHSSLSFNKQNSASSCSLHRL